MSESLTKLHCEIDDSTTLQIAHLVNRHLKKTFPASQPFICQKFRENLKTLRVAVQSKLAGFSLTVVYTAAAMVYTVVYTAAAMVYTVVYTAAAAGIYRGIYCGIYWYFGIYRSYIPVFTRAAIIPLVAAPLLGSPR